MLREQDISVHVYEAKEDINKADDLIRAYIPFIRSEASKCIHRICTEQDDEYSIGLMAFYEAIMGYRKEGGAFLSYASMLIKSRIIDYGRKEKRHSGHLSIYSETGEDGKTLMDDIADDRDHIEQSLGLEATKQEIEELSLVMERYGVSFSDVADNCPKQDRTRAALAAAVNFAAEDGELLSDILKSGRLPLSAIAEGSGVERKTLERHRKYLLAMLLIQTNGYEIIRGHLRHVLKVKGGAAG